MAHSVRLPVLAAFTLTAALLGAAGSGANAQPAPSPAPIVTPTPMMSPSAPPMQMSPPPAISSPTPSASPAASPSEFAIAANPPENPLVTARVRAEFVAWQRGRIDHNTYSPFANGLDIGALVNIVSPLLQIGPPQTVQYQTASLLLGDLVYRYEVIGTMGAVSVLYALDQNGRTDGIEFTPLVFRSVASQGSAAPNP